MKSPIILVSIPLFIVFAIARKKGFLGNCFFSSALGKPYVASSLRHIAEYLDQFIVRASPRN